MYIELHARSAFSFLEAASLPEQLMGLCAHFNMPAMALLDADGVYGAPRFHLAAKKAGLIIGYKVFQASPKSPDQPNVYLEITYKNMAAYAGDIGDQADAFEAVTEKVICSSACQDQARVRRNEFRKVLGTEVTRELVFE